MQNAYTILFELLVQWQLLASEAESLAAELAGNTEELPELRCALLLSLYSLAQQYGAVLELRFALLLRLISFCTATGALGKVLGFCSPGFRGGQRGGQQNASSSEHLGAGRRGGRRGTLEDVRRCPPHRCEDVLASRVRDICK